MRILLNYCTSNTVVKEKKMVLQFENKNFRLYKKQVRKIWFRLLFLKSEYYQDRSIYNFQPRKY